jgi:asparagine synthase (glutamine-hydrolysing)
VDVHTYMVDDILTKVDRMSMAVSLEARVPLLDHHLVEFATSLPAALRVRDGSGKWIWRRAIRGLVPDEVLARPKQGFAIPLRYWFRRELRGRLDALVRPGARIHEYIDAAATERVLREHDTGRRDHSALLWKLLVLEIFVQRLSAAPPQAPR